MNLQGRIDRVVAFCSAFTRWIAGDVRAHWVVAIFSVVVAFGVWIIIEDVTNPRSETRAPASGGITVEAVNVPDGYLPPSLPTVTVQVRGRESDLRELRPEDFRATVDLADYDVDAGGITVPVRVTSRRDGVEVLEVSPGTMRIQLQPAATKPVEVTVLVTASPPSGFRIRQVDGRDVPPSITPQIVTVTGSPELVDRVERVEMEVDLSDARIERYVATGELVAKSAEGNVLQVRLNHTEAEAVFQIESVFARGTIGLDAQITGEIAHGYRIVSVTPDPSTVEVEGPEAVIASLQGPFVLEPIDVTDQTGTFERSRRVEVPDNVQTDVETAVVTVVLEPIRAEGAVYRRLELLAMPAGLTVLPESQVTTEIVIRGNLLDVEAAIADPTLLRPTVSLAGAQAGTSIYEPQVAPPPGVEVVSVSPATIVLAAGPG